MTVNELVKRLNTLQQQGLGNLEVITEICDNGLPMNEPISCVEHIKNSTYFKPYVDNNVWKHEEIKADVVLVGRS